ncbi:MAG: GyrI-like domain-containing protein [Acidobacteriota bacterium]|nr:GyrI-like domain-containing protein [Acidobacteriota bacterium]
MKKRIFVFAALIASLAWTAAAQQPPVDDSLKAPRIMTKPAQKMLVVEAKGDPNTAGQAAFGLLYKTFFSLPGVKTAPPRARWSSPDFGKDAKSEWVGYYALPLPESVTGLPAGIQGVKIEVWKYGEVAEILHVGPYATETPTIETIHKFIAEKGYVIVGLHEEEYLVGPGMGNTPPESYRTIIRYQVKKK